MPEPDDGPPRPSMLRTYVGFWILGLCNNYGYVVMLSAAYDLLQPKINQVEAETLMSNETGRACHEMSTGAILLANIVPSLIVKMIAPFVPLMIHVRIFLTIIVSLSGYFLVASKKSTFIVLSGVACQSASSGLGEASLLAYMHFYNNQNVITSWASGTGGAGILGSITYAILTSLGVTPEAAMYIMTSIPVVMGVSFWIILKKPNTSLNENSETPVEARTFKEKVAILGHLLPVFMVPFGLVYYFEYLINQGLFELLEYPTNYLDKQEQYRWYNFAYQLGVFLSRSSMFLFQLNCLWVMAVLQGINFVVMLFESIYSFIPHISITFVIIVWEGLLGGCSYVNTFRRISTELLPQDREFSMSMNSFSDAIGITLAGLTAIPLHNAICSLPLL